MVPLPTVAATVSWNTRMATTLKKAAQATAYCGFSTPVDTTVAIELAASWKPVMKSNKSARTSRKTIIPMLIDRSAMVFFFLFGASGVFEYDALVQVRGVLAAIGDRIVHFIKLL